MIKRSRRPDSGFLLIRNDVLRDRRLSYRARGLLCAMLSYPDDWQFNRDWLAGQSEGEGQAAVRTALRELERHGYLKRERRKDPLTGKFGWEHVLYDTPQDADSVFAGQSTGRKSTDGKPTAGNPPSKEQLERTTVEEDEVECPHSGRFAPSVGASQNDEHATSGDDVPLTVPGQRQPLGEESSGNWHDEDRELFSSIVGAKLRSNGTKFGKGIWTAEGFYRAYRKGVSGKPLKWPGRYLQSIADRYDGMGVEDWMDDQGLEAVE
jgi:hypothetical protein